MTQRDRRGWKNGEVHDARRKCRGKSVTQEQSEGENAVNKKSRKGGFVVTAELIFVSTICVIGLLTGFVALRDAMIGELVDVASSIGKLNQGYTFTGTSREAASVATDGITFNDVQDTGDAPNGYDWTAYSVDVAASTVE
jgi:hypothetical protein